MGRARTLGTVLALLFAQTCVSAGSARYVADQPYEYHPQIQTEGVSNFIPNSRFECGTAGW